MLQLLSAYYYTPRIIVLFVHRLLEHLIELFKEPPKWDVNHRYTIENTNVYFEGKDKSSIHKVDIQLTLDKILRNEQYVWTMYFLNNNRVNPLTVNTKLNVSDL